MKAPFDTKDALLVKAVGACTGCQHNTASNTLLFPEAAHAAKCMNSKCFKNKTELYFGKELKTVLEDPAIILLSDDYIPGKKSKDLIAKGHKVYAKHNVDLIDLPDPVDEEMIKEIRADYDTKKEQDKEIQSAKDEYQKDLEKYNKAVASGKAVKAFIVEGNAQGRYVYVKLQKEANAVKGDAKTEQKKIASDDATESDIKAEIERLETNSERKHEIENEKIVAPIYELLEDSENDLIKDAPLVKAELIAAIMNTLENTSAEYDVQKKINVGKGDFIDFLNTNTEAQLEKILVMAIRTTLYEELPSHGRVGDKEMVDAMVEFVRVYKPAEVKKIEQERDAVLAAYDEKTKAKIAAMKTQLPVLQRRNNNQPVPGDQVRDTN